MVIIVSATRRTITGALSETGRGNSNDMIVSLPRVAFVLLRLRWSRFIISLRKRTQYGISVLFGVFALLISSKPASAELVYNVTGSDSLAVGQPSIGSFVSYDGTELLSISLTQGNAKKVIVDAFYRVNDGKTTVPAEARAEQTLDASLTGASPGADDPEYLTLLTQPFAVRIDPETIRDVDQMNGAKPFTSVSPLTGSELTGELTKGPPGLVAGFPVITLRFRSDGPLNGTLPHTDEMHLYGNVHMEGSACYRKSDGLLVSIETMLRIAGHIGENDSGPPVSVIYKRAIRATGQAKPSAKADAVQASPTR